MAVVCGTFATEMTRIKRTKGDYGASYAQQEDEDEAS